MNALPAPLRRLLENAAQDARDAAEAGALAALNALAVPHAKPFAHLSEPDKQLRAALRAQARQLGDVVPKDEAAPSIAHLVEKVAYDTWHRLLFTRFLAENQLLQHPGGASVTLQDCEELIREDFMQPKREFTAPDGRTLAVEFAARMLPAIFRADDPAGKVALPPEHRSALLKLIVDLPRDVFLADDSLGWCYQFWQARRKEAVNRSGRKIGANELPAVTQLFTEHYMVLFLLHNTIGAWYAGRKLAEVGSTSPRPSPQSGEGEKIAEIKSEEEARRFCAVPGVDWEYLRFVKSGATVPVADSATGKRDACATLESGATVPVADPPTGKRDACTTLESGATVPVANSEKSNRDDCSTFIPAAGSFPGWPKTLREFRLLDPCCGSGHFLVAAFILLVWLRMQDEGLSARDACDAVLRENLHGLELDPRCTQIAAFNLALTAWRFPDLPAPVGDDVRSLPEGQRLVTSSPTRAIGFRPLPALHIACSGLGVNARKEDWLALANGNDRLRQGMERLYDLFQKAPELGSLIDPRAVGHGDLITAGFAELEPLLGKALEKAQTNDELNEMGVAAQGMARAAEMLASQFHLVVTNVPYLGRGKQDDVLKDYCERVHPNAKADLATCFVERCLDFCEGGATVPVAGSEKGKRDACSTFGSVALVTPQNWLFLGTFRDLREELLRRTTWSTVARLGARAFGTITGEVVSVGLVAFSRISPSEANCFLGIDVSEEKTPSDKGSSLLTKACVQVNQAGQIGNPDCSILLEVIDSQRLLGRFAECFQGLSSTDAERFVLCFWELSCVSPRWRTFQGPPKSTFDFAGRECLLDWQTLSQGVEGSALRGQHAWGKKGVAIGQVSALPATIYLGDLFADSAPVIVPRSPEYAIAVWAFARSAQFNQELRRVNAKLSVNNGYVGKVPFDLAHWQSVAAEKYPHGLPKPHSDDPTQWLFNGYPKVEQPSRLLIQKPASETLAPLLKVAQPSRLPSESPAQSSNRDGCSTLQVAVARLLGYRWPRQTGSSFPDCPALGPDGLEPLADADGIVCIPPVSQEQPADKRLRALLAAAFESGATVPVADSESGKRDACATLESGATVPVASAEEEESNRDGRSTFADILQQTAYFNPYEPIEISERNLPHWRQPGVTYFVTFRLADALPAEKLSQLSAEREAWLKAHPEPHVEEDRQEYFRLFSERIQEWLDAGSGSCLLRDERAGTVVANALKHFDGKRYQLGSWVVMPNHVHATVTPLEGWTLDQILHSWKSYTAHEINRLLNRSGTLWQHEGYDNIVRNPRSLWRIERYIAENPRKAGIATRFVHSRVPEGSGATVPVAENGAGVPLAAPEEKKGNRDGCPTFAWVDSLLAAAGFAGKSLEDWLRNGFAEQHGKLFHQRPFIWHLWDGRKDGFSALVNYHELDRALLDKLIYTYLGDWITRQESGVQSGEGGSDARLTAARDLQRRLKLIAEGEPPHDIFVRWKALACQPIGWEPDLNDGVRLNIRPFVTAGVLRKNPTVNWKKDRGTDPASAPWFAVFKGERTNDHHLTVAEKRAARAAQNQAS